MNGLAVRPVFHTSKPNGTTTVSAIFAQHRSYALLSPPSSSSQSAPTAVIFAPPRTSTLFRANFFSAYSRKFLRSQHLSKPEQTHSSNEERICGATSYRLIEI